MPIASPLRPGPTNTLVDVPGLHVGHAALQGEGALSGVTVVLPPAEGAVAGVDVRGGGPGTRETDALDPRTLVDRVHAVVLSGGSAYGLATASGVMDALGELGRGFPVLGPDQVVPIVPAAVVFDLGRGGRFTARPGPAEGRAALADALAAERAHDDAGARTGARPVPLGVVGAGHGTLVGGLKGGIGSASTVLPDGTTVGAVVVANAAGSAVEPVGGTLWGAAECHDDDLVGAPEIPAHHRDAVLARLTERAAAPTLNTTIGVIGTDTALDVAGCAKLAAVAHDGLARAVRPAHGMTDGDTFFALSTARRPAPDLTARQQILAAGSVCVSRAIVRAVLAATGVDTPAGRWTSYAEAVAG